MGARAAVVYAALPLWLCALGASTQSCADDDRSGMGGPGWMTTGSGADASPDGSHAAGSDAGGPDGSTVTTCAQPFAADAPSTYVAKVKNILVGLPPTDSEVSQVQSGGVTALSTLIDTWMNDSTPLPNGSTYASLYQAKMIRFFEIAFEQTQIDAKTLADTLGAPVVYSNGTNVALMLQNVQEIFPRTMLALAQQGVPFNQAISTRSFMMTTAAKALLAFTDDYIPGDVTSADLVQKANPSASFTVKTTGTTDASTWTFVDPTLQISAQSPQETPGTPCTSLVFPASPPSLPYYVSPWSVNLFAMLMGGLRSDGAGNCTAKAGSQGLLQASDFTDWQMVTFSQPTSGTAAPFPFWDLAGLRSGGAHATSITLDRPVIGFFTLPAFFSNWSTNASNQMRVTANQALIVATNAQVDGTDRTIPNIPDAGAYGLDTDHDQQGSTCYNCHLRLDPTREILSTSYSWNYGWGAKHAKFTPDPAYFVFQGEQGPMSSMADFGTMLSNHPFVAPGWAQKLCYYVNSGACLPDDPAFQSIVAAFQKSYSWDDLLKSVLTSPITTHTAVTTSVTGTATENGNCAPVAVARRDHWCAALNARLGFQDICAENAAVPLVFSYGNTSAQQNIPIGLPADGYARGSTVPVMPNEPSVFFRTGVENFCTYIAQIVIDNAKPPAGAKTWSSSGCTATSCAPIGGNCSQVNGETSCSTVGDFVTLVAGLPASDPRAPLVAGDLMDHFGQALGAVDAGSKGTAALQSAFVAACMAPSAISIGL